MYDIIINPKKVYSTGELFSNDSAKIETISKELAKITNNLAGGWEGDDYHNFIESFEAHVYELNNLIEYLNENGKILKIIALSHSGINEQFIEEIERSELNELDQNQ